MIYKIIVKMLKKKIKKFVTLGRTLAVVSVQGILPSAADDQDKGCLK